MITVEEFRRRLQGNEVDFLLNEVLLAGGARHVTESNIANIRFALARKFGLVDDPPRTLIVGSAKLGFSLTQKKRDDNVLLRYRPFSAESDIDVAVVSPVLFGIIWKEISAFSHRQASFPWDSGRLGDYLVCGWLRPDHFPRLRLRHCDEWWDVFRSLSADSRYGRRKVRGGLYYSMDHLRQYQGRALMDCAKAEDLSK